jgi:glycosyltransferase involved in cell wall biosynthesis
MRKLVYVCSLFHPDDQATSQLFSDLFSAMAMRGFQVEVFAGFPADRECVANERWNGITIHRGGVRVDAKRSLFWRAISYATYCLWLVWMLLSSRLSGKRVLAATNPPFTPILVWICAVARGFDYDLFLLDIYPDGLVAVGTLHETSWFVRSWRALNRCAFAGANRVMLLGRDMADVCERRYGVPRERIFYVPHWAPMSVGQRMRAEQTRLWQRQHLGSKFVVQYSGNMGLWHDMETIIRAAAALADRADIHFLLIGGGIRRASAEQLAQELRLSNVTWIPYQPKSELDDSLACCHAALISQRNGIEGIAVPCKLYGILASGRAVLAQVPEGSETALVVREEDCGLVVRPGDVSALVGAIRKLAENRRRCEELGVSAFAAYRSKYTLDVAVETMSGLCSEPTLTR